MLGQEAAIMKANYQVRVGIHSIYPVHESMISTRIYPMSLQLSVALSHDGIWHRGLALVIYVSPIAVIFFS